MILLHLLNRILALSCILAASLVLHICVADAQTATPDITDPAVIAKIIEAGDSLPPQAVRVSTPTYRVSSNDFLPRLGTFIYEVSWQGIPAAEASVGIERDGAGYRMSTKVRTYSAIDLFYKLRFKADALLRADFRPLRSEFEQRQNSKLKTFRMLFGTDGMIESYRKEQGKDDVLDRFNPHNDTLDPFSSALIARGVDWSDGKVREFDTYNGKCRYLIRMTPTERKIVNYKGEAREVWVIEPKVTNMTKPTAKSKLHEAKIYLTTGVEREIIKITSSVFIGTVTTKLQEFVPAGSTNIQLARN